MVGYAQEKRGVCFKFPRQSLALRNKAAVLASVAEDKTWWRALHSIQMALLRKAMGRGVKGVALLK